MPEVAEVDAPARISPGRRWGMVVGTAAVILVLDQLSKQWALNRLSDGEIIDLIGSLRFKLAFNTGMAFSAGSDSGPIIGVVALGIVVVLALVARRIDSRVQLVLVGTVMGGALGNIIDRLSRVGEMGSTGEGFMSGAVVDFIDLQWWPIFNIADAAVVCGGIALALLSARAPADPDPTADASSDEPETAAPSTDESDSSHP